MSSEYLVSSTVYSVICDLAISPTAPTSPTLKELSNALDSVVDWFSLGVKLGVEDHELRTIERNYRGDGNERCKLEMLSRWLQSGKLPTWKAIIDALHLMGERAVASKIQAKYYRPSTATTDTAGTYVFVYEFIYHVGTWYAEGIVQMLLFPSASSVTVDLINV